MIILERMATHQASTYEGCMATKEGLEFWGTINN